MVAKFLKSQNRLNENSFTINLETIAILVYCINGLRLLPKGRIGIAAHRSINDVASLVPADEDAIVQARAPKAAEFFKLPMLEPEEHKHRMLRAVNAQGRELLPSMPTPYYKQEAWRGVKLTKLFQTRHLRAAAAAQPAHTVSLHSLLPYVDERSMRSRVVFVDGLFRPELSDISGLGADVRLSVIQNESQGQHHAFEGVADEEGLRQVLGEVLERQEESRDSFGSDVLGACNMALLDSVCVLNISSSATPAADHPDEAQAAGNRGDLQPIQLLFVSAVAQRVVSSFPRVVVQLQENARAALKQTYLSLPCADAAAAEERANYVGAYTQIRLAGNASLAHSYAQWLGRRARHTEVLSVQVHEGARYDVSVVQAGGEVSRVNMLVDLLAPGANCSIGAAMLAEEGQSLDMHTS
eukprot:gene39326-47868_t